MKQGEKKDTIKTLYQFPNLPAGLSLKDETPLSDAPAFYLLLLLGETKDWAGRNIAMQVREFPCYFEVLLDVKYYHAFARCLELTGETNRAKALYGEMKAFAERNLVNYPGMSDWWNPLLALAFKGLGDMQEAEKRLSECLTAHPSPFYQIELDELRNLTS